MFTQILALLALTGFSAATTNITFVTLDKTSNSTGGTGSVAIAGTLDPFGGIGAGCGVNYNSGFSYGGGLTAGSEAYGLGGGFNITPTTLTVGLGIGINPSNSSADVNFQGHTNGTFALRFSSSEPFACVPSVEEGSNVVVCTTI